jgi:hypothetical protein
MCSHQGQAHQTSSASTVAAGVEPELVAVDGGDTAAVVVQHEELAVQNDEDNVAVGVEDELAAKDVAEVGDGIKDEAAAKTCV